MLQFFFLSIASNLIAGLILCGDAFARRFPAVASLTNPLSRRRVKLVTGLASLMVGFATLFVPVDGPLVLGDLFPSTLGMAMGIALLFEVLRQDSFLPSEPSERAERPPVGYRTTLGWLGLAAAALHFFLPERPFF